MLLIFGGRSVNDYNDAYVYDDHSKTWTRLEYKSKNNVPCERRRAVCGMVNNLFIVFGGFANNQYLGDFQIGEITFPTPCDSTDYLGRDLAAMIDNPQTSDISIVNNGKEWHLHKPMLLYTLSETEIQNSLFAKGVKEMKMKETKNMTDIFKEMDSFSFKLLLEYLYSETIVTKASIKETELLCKFLKNLSLTEKQAMLTKELELIANYYSKQKISTEKRKSLIKIHTKLGTMTTHSCNAIEQYVFPECLFKINLVDTTFQIYKALIYARSRYFKSKLKYSNADTYDSVFTDAMFIDTIVDYYYTGNADITSYRNNLLLLVQLTIIALFFIEEPLIAQCNHAVKLLLDKESLLFLIAFAYIYSNFGLFEICLEYMGIKKIPAAQVLTLLKAKLKGQTVQGIHRRLSNYELYHTEVKETQNITTKLFFDEYIPEQYLLPPIVPTKICDSKTELVACKGETPLPILQQGSIDQVL